MYSQNIILIFFLIYFNFINIVNGDGMNVYSTSEKSAIEKLRSLVQDVIVRDWDNTDDYLIKWLRVNNMNVNDAATKYRENVKWRNDNRIASSVNETILKFNREPYVIDGYDNEGYPIVTFTPTFIDLRKLVIQGLREKIIRYFFQMLERTTNVVIQTPKGLDGRNITRLVAILDLQGFNLRQHFCLECIGIFREWFIGLEKYYPESLQHFVLINVPRTAKQLVEIIRALLSPASEKALKLFEPTKKEWSTFLLSIISADQLPYRFGGTKKSE